MKNLLDYGFKATNNVYVIAEIGINHSGNIDNAKCLIESASRTGADAVKFQTYITEKRVPKDSPIFDNLKRCELPFEAFGELQEFALDHGVQFFSTPFDEESVDFLEGIGCELYKVSSFDVVNHKLLKKISSTGKPVIMSVGMANIEEIQKAYEILNAENYKIAITHCISAYPTKEEDSKLATIQLLKENFDCIVGLSDHSSDIAVPLYAVAAGAQVIEKHYRIDENMQCADAVVSITEKQMIQMVNEIGRIKKIFGDGELGVRKIEEGTTMFRRPTILP